jgi:uncharacterized protein (DUF885 family)
MLSRRQIFVSAVATAAVLPFSSALAQAAKAVAGTPHDKLNALFDVFMDENLRLSPEFATSLGVDTGEKAAERGELSDNSPAGIEKAIAVTLSQQKRLAAFSRAGLTGMDRINYDIVLYGMNNQVESLKRFKYANGQAGSPYQISQLSGSYSGTPDFLDSQHPIETKADADAYISRLSALATVLDNELIQVRNDEKLGVIPPDFILDKTLVQMQALRDQGPDKVVLVQSVVRRTKAKNIAGDWEAQASAIYTGKIQPALDRQIAVMKELRGKATHDAGVWKLPDGQAYYEASLKNWATTSMSPAEIHKVGLDLVADFTARIDTIMKAQGLTQGTVGERLRGMYQDPKFRYPNTDEGKEKLLSDLNEKVRVVQAKLPGYFNTLPKAKLEIKRVPKYTEAGAPGGYYNPGALDGSRPGAYYINLRDTAEVPSWTLSTLTYHEGIPGHHLQLSLQQEADLPLIRKVSFFSAYMEGWALYAEQLADEMGMYETDPWGKIGYLHDAMFRAVRLVVDTGMHAMRWERERAIKYFVDVLGDQDASATTEVERYCVWPGQACTYMLGKLDWLKNREKAKAALGDRFKLGDFHDAGLLSGAMPLAVLDEVMDGYIASKKG